jgi:predicted transcriptional regulator
MELEVKEIKEIVKLAQVLSSESRVKILKIINNRELSLSEITEELNLTKGTISSHITLLESLGLIDVKFQPGVKGIKKLIKSKYNKIIIII